MQFNSFARYTGKWVFSYYISKDNNFLNKYTNHFIEMLEHLSKYQIFEILGYKINSKEYVIQPEDIYSYDFWLSVFLTKKNYDTIKVIKNNFPKLKIISKGDRILANGEETLVNTLKIRLDTLIILMNQNIKINNKSIDLVMSGKVNKLLTSIDKRVILFGNGKKEIKAHTVNQIKIVESFD